MLPFGNSVYLFWNIVMAVVEETDIGEQEMKADRKTAAFELGN